MNAASDCFDKIHPIKKRRGTTIRPAFRLFSAFVSACVFDARVVPCSRAIVTIPQTDCREAAHHPAEQAPSRRSAELGFYSQPFHSGSRLKETQIRQRFSIELCGM